jgi:RNA polymerase sporulation-specific sigma factor
VDYTQDDVTKNMGLVFMVAKRMKHLTKNATTDFEDLVSDGVEGLIYALSRFDPERGFRFSSYAYRCISGYMLRGHRTVNQETWKALQSKYDVPCNTIPMFQPYFDSDEVREVVGCDDRGMNAKTMFNTVNNRTVWEHLLPVLSPRQRQVITMSMDDITQVEIAEKLGVTRQCVSQTVQLAIKRAKTFFAVEEAA